MKRLAPAALAALLLLSSCAAREMSLDLGDHVMLKLARIPAGQFLMGSPPAEPNRDEDELLHPVTVTKPFYMAETHVTVAQFAAFVKATNYVTDAQKVGWSWGLELTTAKAVPKLVDGCNWRSPSFSQGGDEPVVQVSWNDAQAFCAWLAKKTGRKVVLPTEAQWEYACRAGKTTAYPWGDNPAAGNGWANCADQSLRQRIPDAPAAWFFPWDDGFAFTAPVACFKANAFGLYDMIGNAWQWCADCYGPYSAAAAVDPTGPIKGNFRVLRGGSWFGLPATCRSAARDENDRWSRSDYVGFRVAVDP